MSVSHFAMQTNKVLLISVTTVILDQGHRKVIQYILLDLYVLCLKYMPRLSTNCFSGGSGDGGGNELQNINHSKPGWLNKMITLRNTLANGYVYQNNSSPNPQMGCQNPDQKHSIHTEKIKSDRYLMEQIYAI